MTIPAPLARRGVTAPGYTQIPNEILDEMPRMKEAELRITLAIARQTFGWQKSKDMLSIGRLMQLTGLSRQGVQNGIAAALQRGTIDREPATRQMYYYFLVVNVVDRLDTEPVNVVDQSKHKPVNVVDRTSQRSRPVPVNVVDTQNKYKKTNTKKRTNGGRNGVPSTTPQPAAADSAFQLITSVITDFSQTLQKPFVNIPDMTRQLLNKQLTSRDVAAAVAACQSADNPAGAFVYWVKNGVLPQTRTRAVPKPKGVPANPYAALSEAERTALVAGWEPIEDDEP